MASIVFDRVEFHYRDPFQDVFGGLELTLETSWRTALVGRNGRGKTTLLRLVAAALEPTAGRLLVPPVEARLFPGDPADPARSTLEVVRTAIAPFDAWRLEMETLASAHDAASLARWAELEKRFAAAGGWDVDARIDRELALLGLDPSALARPFGSLSGGEQTRALIAALFLVPAAFPLIDEPTNHLDLAGRQRLSEYLARKPGFLLASHDRALLDACADHTIAIERSGVTVTRGGYSAWKREHERSQEHERRRRETLERQMARLRRASRDRRDGATKKEREKRGAGDRGFIGHRAAKQMKRAKEIERRVERRIEEHATLLRDWEKERALALPPAAGSPEVLLRVVDLGLRVGPRRLIERLSFTVRRGQRIVVTGPNGCGKTKLLELAAGGELPAPFVVEGSVALTARARVERALQMPRWASGSLRERLLEAGADETRFRQILGALGVERQVFEHPLETLSQGQKKKVELAHSFVDERDLLLWDEPMNWLDAATREAIEEAILESAPAMLVVEHDRAFIECVATEVIALG